ncbi:Phosducin-like protein 2 [Entophlyctis sp. JEL0112]|nr:Phosducin-like protein 2 [Entophlyctis sp. JEL0112]
MQRQILEESRWKESAGENEDIDEIIKNFEDEDDEFVKEYKARRLAEMIKSGSRPKFGYVQELEVDDFVAFIENNDPDVVVVIHLYEPHIEACRLTNQYLQDLAPRHPHVRMAKILSKKADISFDQVALPALLVYQNGEMFRTLLRVTDEIDGWAQTGRCSLAAFEEFLEREQVLG